MTIEYTNEVVLIAACLLLITVVLILLINRKTVIEKTRGPLKNNMAKTSNKKESTITVITQMDDKQLSANIQTLFDYFSKKDSREYYRKITLDKSSEDKVVVVGDIHCDFASLSTLYKKLSSDRNYDYVKKGYFVFLGDYIDRGHNMLKTILLLLLIKKKMGDRCILLRGNHELIFCQDGILKSYVDPSETADELNGKFAKKQVFLESFANYFNKLPTYCIVSVQEKNILLVHGSIPKDEFTEAGAYIDTPTGEIKFSKEPPEDIDSFRRRMLLSMLWGDPKEVKRKLQIARESRFEFGNEQFNTFMTNSKLNVLIRSHEPEKEGLKTFFDGRLHTIFSSGHIGNPDSQYGIEGSFFGVISPKIEIINHNAEIDNMNIY